MTEFKREKNILLILQFMLVDRTMTEFKKDKVMFFSNLQIQDYFKMKFINKTLLKDSISFVLVQSTPSECDHSVHVLHTR